MIDIALLAARGELQSRANDKATFAYLKRERVSISTLLGRIGFFTVTPIAEHASLRFDFEDGEEAVSGFVMEAFGADDESVADLVAWPIDAPERVLSMFGRLAFCGLAEVLSPATYVCGCPVDIHRNVLGWLLAGRGAAIVCPELAASILLDLPGPIAGRDDAHAVQLAALARSAIPRFDPSKFLSASQPRRAA